MDSAAGRLLHLTTLGPAIYNSIPSPSSPSKPLSTFARHLTRPPSTVAAYMHPSCDHANPLHLAYHSPPCVWRSRALAPSSGRLSALNTEMMYVWCDHPIPSRVSVSPTTTQHTLSHSETSPIVTSPRRTRHGIMFSPPCADYLTCPHPCVLHAELLCYLRPTMLENRALSARLFPTLRVGDD